MSYDDAFYKLYDDYLHEPRVHTVHHTAILWASRHMRNRRSSVVDLGCGIHQEYRRHGFWGSYHGLDLNADEPRGRVDYRSPEALDIVEETGADIFVSLFSTEITAPAQDNRTLYENLFERSRRLRSGLVSGFYYTDKLNENPVREAGGVVSYQTLDPLGHPDLQSDAYTELRLTLRCPSELFGENVVEVWRLLERA